MAPGIETIVETGIYADDLEAAERFYVGVLGLTVHSKEPGRHLFFAVGHGSMLLVFDPRTTSKGEGLPGHGATGPGHFALGIRAETLPAWRDWLARQGVAIEQEVKWPRGGISLYFRDPAGNA